MGSWLVWVVIGVPVALVLAWERRHTTRRIDAIRRYDPDTAAQIEAAFYTPGRAGLPTRIRGFDKRDHS